MSENFKTVGNKKNLIFQSGLSVTIPTAVVGRGGLIGLTSIFWSSEKWMVLYLHSLYIV